MSTNQLVEQQRKELQGQIDLLGAKIERLRKALAIEANAASKFELEKQIEEAEAERDRLIARLDGLEVQKEPLWKQRYRVLAAAAQESSNISLEPGDARALLEAHRQGDPATPSRVYEVASWWIKRLCSQAPDDASCYESMMTALHAWVASQEDGRPIWRSAAVQTTLETLRSELKGKGWRQSADLIAQTDALFAIALRWPRLWPKHRLADGLEFDRIREHYALRFNPFGPERAEHDPHLPEFAWEGTLNIAARPRPMLIIGAEGSGKSALARLLVQRYPGKGPPSSGAFPIYLWPPPDLDAPKKRKEWLEVIEEAFADSLVGFLALNPLAFDPTSRKAALAVLLRRYDSQEALQFALSQWGPDHALDQLGAETIGPGHLSEAECLHLLERTLSPLFSYFDLIVDLSISPAQARHPIVACNLDTLIELAAVLAEHRIYVKLLLSPVNFFEPPTWIEQITLHWAPSMLREMLEARFQAAGPAEFAQFCDPREGDLTDRLIELSQGSPRRLVRIGNGLWRKLAAAGRYRIIAADLDEG